MQKSLSYGMLALLFTLAPLTRANLIQNGNFALTTNGYSEVLTPEFWTNVGHTDGVIADSVFGTPAYGGSSYYYDLGGYGGAQPTSGDGIEQTVATTVGSSYTLTLGVANENYTGWGPEYLNVLVNGVSIGQYSMVYNSAYGGFQLPWATDSLTFTASSASSTIEFTVTGTGLGGQDPLIAGIDLEPAGTTASPEPAPMFGLLAGLGVLVVWYRKSQLNRA